MESTDYFWYPSPLAFAWVRFEGRTYETVMLFADSMFLTSMISSPVGIWRGINRSSQPGHLWRAIFMAELELVSLLRPIWSLKEPGFNALAIFNCVWCLLSIFVLRRSEVKTWLLPKIGFPALVWVLYALYRFGLYDVNFWLTLPFAANGLIATYWFVTMQKGIIALPDSKQRSDEKRDVELGRPEIGEKEEVAVVVTDTYVPDIEKAELAA